MRATLKDIAKKVGVSTTLVSLYLNKHPLSSRIAKSTKEKIDRAVSELHYMPNRAAKTLFSGKSGTIGLMIGGLTDRIRGCFLHVLMNRAKEKGYHLLITNTNYDQIEEQEELEYMLSLQVDAILYHLKLDPKSKIAVQLKNSHFPILLHIPQPDDSFNQIGHTDDAVRGALLALEKRGHTRIGIVGNESLQDSLETDPSTYFHGELFLLPLISRNEKEVLQRIRKEKITALLLFEKNPGKVLHPIEKIRKDMEIVVSYALPFHYEAHPMITGAMYTDFFKRAEMEIDRIVEIIRHPEAPPEIVRCKSRYLDRRELDALYASQLKDPMYQDFL